MLLRIGAGTAMFSCASTARQASTASAGTIDDAPRRAFDKLARLLACPNPAGPSFEAEAARGDSHAPSPARRFMNRPAATQLLRASKTPSCG